MEQSHIRNFAIIAHIDHGKSTLSDRFLEITNTISKEKLGENEQFLDQNPISRKRGITIKLAPVRMKYQHQGQEYQLNLIDTPGHVDFSYEVSRTLAACEGVILLVDATQGIQAQTVAHYRAAKKENLVMIPVINKVDLDSAQPEVVSKEMQVAFGFAPEEILHISAKSGKNVAELLHNVIEQVPPPQGNPNASFRALIFDAVYDDHKGVVACVRIVDGSITQGNGIEMFQTKTKTPALDCGYFSPYLVSSQKLMTGEIGYMVSGIKDIRLCRVGDTIGLQNAPIAPLPGYITPKPMIFFGVYPQSADEFSYLRECLQKYALTDAALTFSEEYSPFLGSGFRVGFLGLLHAEIFKERLKQEFNIDPLLTMPHVLYEQKEDGSYREPYMHLTVFTPQDYVGPIMTICQKKKGNMLTMEYQESYATLDYEMPYSMFIRGLSADLKTMSSGFASIDYELIDYRDADIVNLEVRINDTPIDVLSEFVYSSEVNAMARRKAEKLKESLPRQQVKQVIQCFAGGHILAREEVPAFRKDVLAKMSGGDRTRKDKLLEKQKKGKKKMIGIAKIDIPQEALLAMIKN